MCGVLAQPAKHVLASMIASWTSAPIAIVMPPSVTVLIVMS
jgi:hypothetical protein